MTIGVMEISFQDTESSGVLAQLNEFLSREACANCIAVQHIKDLYRSAQDVIDGKPAGAHFLLTFTVDAA